MTRRRTRTPLWVLAGVLLAGLAVDHGSAPTSRPDAAPPTALPPTASAPTASAPTASAPTDAAQALQLLGMLAVKGRAPMTGYRRAEFGESWVDTDGNGCRTRDDVLARDLTAPRFRDRCVVVAGTLLDPYTHHLVVFRKEDAAQVQVDHVVALADAWQKGAQRWTLDERVRFANDPLELLAVSGAVNQEKGSSDAASWLPPYKPFRCSYVTRQVQVKARYRLCVTAAEREAIRRVLGTCR